MIDEIYKSFSELYDKGYEAGYKKAKKDFERPHGEWIRYTEEGFDYAKCSACKWDSGEAFEYAIDRFPFCPNCGADMREEGGER